MNRVMVVLLCLMLSLTGFTVPEVSAASRSTASAKTALISFLQQEYLTMSDVRQTVFARYPILTPFRTVSMSRLAMMIALRQSAANDDVVRSSSTRAPSILAVGDAIAGVPSSGTAVNSLEQSTAPVTTKPAGKTIVTGAKAAQTPKTSASSGSHTITKVVPKTATPAPLPIPPPVPSPVTPPPKVSPPIVVESPPLPVAPPATSPATPAQHVVSFTPSQTAGDFLTLLGDESIDVIEMAGGTYRLSCIIINIDRTRPVVVRPVAGAVVVMSGTRVGTDPQFWLGLNGTAGNITMQGLIFDGFILGQQGIVQACDAHDITLNDMVVRNSRANPKYAEPNHAWAIYLAATATVSPTNFTANRWTVDGSARRMSGLLVYGGRHITAIGWSVSNAYYAVYASAKETHLTDFVLDGWTISDTGAPAWREPDVSVAIEYASGRFSNMWATSSGVLLNFGTPRMTDGGGNTW
jgi:hypothetical protein